MCCKNRDDEGRAVFKPRGFLIGLRMMVAPRERLAPVIDGRLVDRSRAFRSGERREKENNYGDIALRSRCLKRTAGAGDFGPIYL